MFSCNVDAIKLSLPTVEIVLLIYQFRVSDRDRSAERVLIHAVHHLINV